MTSPDNPAPERRCRCQHPAWCAERGECYYDHEPPAGLVFAQHPQPPADIKALVEDVREAASFLASDYAYRLAASCERAADAMERQVPTGATGIVSDLKAFHAAFSVPDLPSPMLPPRYRVELRASLIDEEWRETKSAMEAGDMIEIADGLADLIYVAVGTCLEYGIPLDRVWTEVHRSNMAKVDPATGKVRYREDGKVLKPEGWTKPDIARALAASPTPPSEGGAK